MKIAQIHPGCGIPVPPSSWGAIEKIVWEFICNLKELGHEVDLKWAGEVQPGQYDIVHCHVANLALSLAERGIPYIYQMHDHHAYHYGKDSFIFKQNLKAIEHSEIALLPAKFLVNYFGSEKGVYFSHGVNDKEFYPIPKEKPSKPKLLMVANNGLANNPAYDRKGFEFGITLALINNLDITIAGPSHNKHFFNSHLWTLSYPKLNIIFDLHNKDLLKLYHKHDVFVHPTMLEAGHPNLTMLEAAAAGLPTIANWENETLFHGAWRAPRDIFEMNRGLKHIMDNWDWYREGCQTTLNQLNWKNRTIDLVKIYEERIN